MRRWQCALAAWDAMSASHLLSAIAGRLRGNALPADSVSRIDWTMLALRPSIELQQDYAVDMRARTSVDLPALLEADQEPP